MVVLAAGEGRRAGGPKAWHEVKGRPWLERQLETLAGANPLSTVVVLAARPAGPTQIAVLKSSRWGINPDPSRGPFSSLQIGLRTLGPHVEPVFVLPVDVPAPGADVFQALRDALGEAWAAVPACDGRGGHPVLLSRAAQAELVRLEPEAPESRLDLWLRSQGPSRVRRMPTSDRRVITNLNSPEDFETLERG